MKNLYIFDISGIVYYGTTGFGKIGANDNCYKGFQIGGIKTLMSRLAVALADRNDVVLAFDAHSFRKDLLGDYKSDRTPNRYVSAQIDLLYDYLAKAGINCYKIDGYEADDIIAWAVQRNKNNYANTIIYSNDHDIAHNVQKNVMLKPIDTKGIIITESQFQRALSTTDDIRFNTISAYKVFCGCKSDHIPKIKVSGGFVPVTIYKRFLRFLDENNLKSYEAMTSPKVLAVFTNTVGLFDEADKREIFNRIHLIYPAERPEEIEIKPTVAECVDRDVLGFLLAMCRDNASARMLGCKNFSVPEDLNQRVQSLATLLKTGAYSVDRNLEVDPTYEVDSRMLFLKEF